MKKILYLAFAMTMSLTACGTPLASTTTGSTTSDQSKLGKLGNVLGGLTGSSSSSSSSSGSSLGDALTGLVSGLLSTDKVTPADMVGTWKYSAPAVCFQSDNFLQKAGGSAAAGVIENKLAPYYKKFGFNKLQLTIDEEKNFSMNLGIIPLKGTVDADGNGNVYFNFTALGTVSLGKMKAYVNMGAGKSSMELMFDVSQLMKIIKAVASVSGSSTISTVSDLLNSYDGICAGFKLNKQ